MSTNCERRSIKAPGGDSHDLFGAEFIGSPCHHRVLKPPGGGTSDIFGGSEPVEKPIVRKKSVQASSIVLDDSPVSNGVPIENGHSKQDAPAPAPATKPAQPMTNGKATNGEVKNAAPAASRQRVPPGGFSSGLW